MNVSALPLPSWCERLATPERLALAAEFVRFGCVGFLGFLADTACVYALKGAIGLYAAGFVSYLIVGTANWLLNRLWTFRDRERGRGDVRRQWVLFLAVNAIGLALNRGAYVLTLAFWSLARAYPVISVFAGAVAGMFVNFALNRRWVFRA
ncbi:MAG: GtrA family protein [Acidisphaera sp.]|nr:GtrA family protein [Acidisphaera sp.]